MLLLADWAQRIVTFRPDAPLAGGWLALSRCTWSWA
jgi:hypothetical protein